MSGNSEAEPIPEPSELLDPHKRMDARVRFTREVLGDALVALMQERSFEQITVQDILTRAGVGRTTFYNHYSDKDDLFLSDVEEFLEGMAGYLDRCQAPVSRLAPVRELFAHLLDMTEFYKVLNASGKLAEVRELGIGCFAKSIERRLLMTPCNRSRPQLRATSHALAGALFALLNWWMYEPERISPEEANDLFHELAWNGIQPLSSGKRPRLGAP